MKHQSFSSRKSAQKQFVLLLTLTLCLILILNLLLYNHRAQQLYTEQLKKDNYNTALQISREFDASMDLMRTACWNMVHNNREFIRIVETYDNSFEHKTALMSYLSSMLPVNEYFDSVYLYLPNYQTVLSTASSIPFPLTICCHRTNEPVCAHCTAAPPPMCSEDRIYPQSS